ncbi:MAG: tyrosine--tRNA ligase [Thaumarchaeota archaeon]|nr:tyrosine--tRNA ligase [Nitrososphaerota archaeon]
MDVTEKVRLVTRDPTEEVVTEEELVSLFNTNDHPKHYIGLEISGFLHLGSLILTGYKINDFIRAGVRCTVFLADWHTYINNKLGGDWDKIRMVSKYYADAFRLFCPGVEIIEGSGLYEARKGYWMDLVRFSKNMSLDRTMRSLTIMGRSGDRDKIDLGQLFYPPMQAVDIHSLDLDIMHAGMDQRKIHMLVREIFPKLKWKVPVAVHHHILAGLGEPQAAPDADSQIVSSKMSKSKSSSGIFIHDTDEEIESKFRKAWCPEGVVDKNPILEIFRYVVFHELEKISIERPEKFGGNVAYASYGELEADFAARKLHPSDLKLAAARYVSDIIRPVREKLVLSDDLRDAIKGTT